MPPIEAEENWQVHIGIVTYNSRDDIPACIEAIEHQTYPQMQFSVVDNASTDGTSIWLAEHLEPGQYTLNTDNRGFAGGHNQIIQSIDEAYYLALNPDVILEPNYVALLVDCVKRRSAGRVMGKLIQMGSDPPRLYSAGHALLANGFAFNIGHGEPDSGQYNEERAVFGASGAAALYTPALLHDSGSPFFDETLFAYAEDVDVDWRGQRQGWSCWYCPEAVAYHRGGNPSPYWQSVALANRYLVAIKNACRKNLLMIILPNLILHSLFRLIVTPRAGWRMTGRIVQNLPEMWHKRLPDDDTCQQMEQWFAWSQKQSGAAHTLRQRWQAFWQDYRSSKL